MASFSIPIQIISLLGTALFMITIFRLIVRGKLREEYSIIWILCTVVLIVFSIWRQGLDQISLLLGVYYPPSLIFLGAIFAIIVFLVHLSVVNSKLQGQIKDLSQEVAMLKKELSDMRKGQVQIQQEEAASVETK